MSLLYVIYRVLLDRAHSALDSIFHSLDSHIEGDLAASASPPLLENSSHSSTPFPNSSSQISTSPPDLRQILQNIKTCRWRHFKPRTLKSQSDTRGSSSHCGLRSFSRSLTTALGSGINTPNRGAASLNSSLGGLYACTSILHISCVSLSGFSSHNLCFGEEYYDKLLRKCQISHYTCNTEIVFFPHS